MQRMNRIEPQGRVQDYKTYQILSPIPTHWVPASCADIDCPQYLKGWRVRVEGLPPEMVHTARTTGRKFTELNISETENWLVFEAGQPCFRASQHKKLLDKQEIFVARDGDFRGNPTGNVRKHTRPEFWLEDFAEHQEQLARQIQQG
jgi:hypothetical protein